jgi:glycosyltransferase involved in cell wall biosynthesis
MGVNLAVLITYHDEGPLLTECLDSLRNGTSQPDEILVYDDASRIPPEPFVPPGMPVRIITGKENRGPSHGRNVLLNTSTGTHIHFHDADDLFAPDWCDAVRSKFEAEDVDAVFTDVARFQHGQGSEDGRTDLTELASKPDLVRYCLSHSLLPASATYLRRRVLDIGGYSESYCQSEDYDFHIRLAAGGLRFTVIPQPLVLQRLHDSNRSKDHLRVWSDGVKILETLAGELRPEYLPDVCDALARAGRVLFQLGAIAEARHAFVAASRFGCPRFQGESGAYRLTSRFCGPMAAERIGCAYRSLLPGSVRERLRMIGSGRKWRDRAYNFGGRG